MALHGLVFILLDRVVSAQMYEKAFSPRAAHGEKLATAENKEAGPPPGLARGKDENFHWTTASDDATAGATVFKMTPQ